MYSIIGICDLLILVFYIILGDSMFLDIVRVIGWRNDLEVLLDEKFEVCYVVLFVG